jgi:Zn-dependent protease
MKVAVELVLEYQAQALPFIHQSGDRRREAHQLLDIGAGYIKTGQPVKAIESLTRALSLMRQLGDRNGEATALNSLGVAYFRAGQTRKAVESLNQALPIWRELGDKRNEAITLQGIKNVEKLPRIVLFVGLVLLFLVFVVCVLAALARRRRRAGAAPNPGISAIVPLPAPKASIRPFEFSGIEVFLHFSWFLVAAFEVQSRRGQYSSIVWNVLEYLSLFLIVTMHEFGHALACRQVGGRASRILLWPMGGVAYVDPPPRAGAMLWSIAAGPLVNVVLLPVLMVAWSAVSLAGVTAANPDLIHFVQAVTRINVGLLIFNLLPVYPPDGGQILRSLLWFVVGRARSLMAAAVIGLLGEIAK